MDPTQRLADPARLDGVGDMGTMTEADVGREYVRALIHRTDRAIARARPLLREDTTLSMFTQIVEDITDLRDAPMIPLLDRLARMVAWRSRTSRARIGRIRNSPSSVGYCSKSLAPSRRSSA